MWFLTFQFLIGRLKTMLEENLELEMIEFQFLIGRLKTYYRKFYLYPPPPVSIPYR